MIKLFKYQFKLTIWFYQLRKTKKKKQSVIRLLSKLSPVADNLLFIKKKIFRLFIESLPQCEKTNHQMNSLLSI
jgi:hypothetical protein